MATRPWLALVFTFVLPACGDDGPPVSSPASCGAPAASDVPGQVATTSGLVQGKLAGGTWTWQGVPFAAPPVGPLRFAPPVAAPCWEGVKLATAFAPACLQKGEDGTITGSEDCLTLNVWAPESASASSALPVLVFIHGGGHQQGSASQEVVPGLRLYDGQHFVERSGALLVTLDYRLGPFGFLAHPALSAERPEKSGNYGMLDQIFALEWVKHNIARFGGDPARVLVFGESAGAVSTCRLVASPLAAGLFASAIVESGACTAKPLAEAEAQGVTVAEAVGCSDVACLRDVSADALVATVAPLEGASLRQTYDGVIDGVAVPEHPIASIESGRHNAVPVIIGTNTEEQGRAVPAITSEAEYAEAVRAYAASLGAPGLAPLLLARYPVSDYASPRAAFVALATDFKFACPARKALRAFEQGQSPAVYRYVFGHVADNAAPRVKALGATHGSELAFVFDALPNPGAGDELVAAAFNGYWSRLAATGDPNGGQAPTWPAYEALGEPHLAIDAPLAVGTAYRAPQCDFLENLLENLGGT